MYVSCEQLDLKELTLRVGVFDAGIHHHPVSQRLSAGPVTVDVRYRTGEPFYAIDTSFVREGLTQNVSAGPFSDTDQTGG